MPGYQIVYDVLTERDEQPPPTGSGWFWLSSALCASGLICAGLGYWAGLSLGAHRHDLLYLGGSALVMGTGVAAIVTHSAGEYERQIRLRKLARRGAGQVVVGSVESFETRVVGRNAFAGQISTLRIAGLEFKAWAGRWPKLAPGRVARITHLDGEVLRIEVREDAPAPRE